ncbi:hypothetical protein EDC26_11334 [Paralcaligenes ureilyticus]|uniref:Uncharacterized protein n=1 Tax=Paralcaligenes ureilyticus TaxID=627131 RepID=A0A4R3LZ85_9BURK|nr:hypothetical protein EDC26_11334 [Paralcaligenes ureilyticus]
MANERHASAVRWCRIIHWYASASAILIGNDFGSHKGCHYTRYGHVL